MQKQFLITLAICYWITKPILHRTTDNQVLRLLQTQNIKYWQTLKNELIGSRFSAAHQIKFSNWPDWLGVFGPRDWI